jgi:hypothetical protein
VWIAVFIAFLGELILGKKDTCQSMEAGIGDIILRGTLSAPLNLITYCLLKPQAKTFFLPSL